MLVFKLIFTAGGLVGGAFLAWFMFYDWIYENLPIGVSVFTYFAITAAGGVLGWMIVAGVGAFWLKKKGAA